MLYQTGRKAANGPRHQKSNTCVSSTSIVFPGFYKRGLYASFYLHVVTSSSGPSSDSVRAHPPNLDFETRGNLLIFTDFQLPFLFLSSRLPFFHIFHSSEPLLPKPPKITKNGRAPPRWRQSVVLFGKVWKREERNLLKSSQDSTHHSLEVIGFCRHRFGMALD